MEIQKTSSPPRIPKYSLRVQLKFRKEMYLDVFFILCIVSYGVGVSGFFRKFKKPFSCETCMAFWSSLLYIICTGNFNLKGIALCCLCSFLATPFANLLIVTREILNWILIKITPRYVRD